MGNNYERCYSVDVPKQYRRRLHLRNLRVRPHPHPHLHPRRPLLRLRRVYSLRLLLPPRD